MKKTVTLLFLLLFSAAGFSQVELDYSVTPKTQATGMSIKGLSPESAQFLSLCRKADSLKSRSARKTARAQLRERYGVQRGKVAAIVELVEGHSPQELSAYGVSVNSSAGGILTVMIPVNRFAELAESGICKIIDVGRKMTAMMDNVRGSLGIDGIYAGLNLPHGYDGSGVVVGIIDQGFQYCHPSFYDSTGNVLRVKRVWNQRDTVGPFFSTYGYGVEYTTEAQMMAAFSDDSLQPHGTHVAGTAAGCGAPAGNGSAYRGIAPAADLVFVSTLFTEAAIIDGINYIHNYAQSVGKPCVINMSFGSSEGPHDGTELSDRFITSFVQQHPDSLAFVCAAGNRGGEQIHLSKQFSATDTVLTTQLRKSLSAIFYSDLWMEIWNEQVFRVGLSLLDPNTETQEDFTGFFTAGSDTLIETCLISNSNDSLHLKLTFSQRSSYNQHYSVRINVEYETAVMNYKQLILTMVCDTASMMHAWSESLTFNGSAHLADAMDGDDQYSIEGFGGTTDAVISVGSYVTRKNYTTYTGDYHHSYSAMGGISDFSSIGPTRDGRVKPDITAPGEIIVAPYNQYSDIPDGCAVYDTTQWNGQTELFGTISGTSMSSPVMAGVVALWMQQNPALGTDSLRSIIHGTARNDRFTGPAVSNPNNVWGYGKVNAYGGLPVSTNMFLVNAFGIEEVFGTVTGGGTLGEGFHTLTAVPNGLSQFVQWEDGITDNPRTVNVTCDTTFVAVFEAIHYEDCDTIRDYPWTAEIDDNFTCWKQIDVDEDGRCWMTSPSYVASIAMGNPNADNWLVSSPMEINAPLVANLSMRGVAGSGSQDCSLLISTSGSETSDFSTVLDSHTNTGSEYFGLNASLSDYQGQVVRLAVRHYNVVGMALTMSFDNFTVELDTTISVTSHEIRDYTVSSNGLQLTVRGAEGHALQLYDMMGRLLTQRRSADCTYQLPAPGVYILRVDGFKPRKVVVVR